MTLVPIHFPSPGKLQVPFGGVVRGIYTSSALPLTFRCNDTTVVDRLSAAPLALLAPIVDWFRVTPGDVLELLCGDPLDVPSVTLLVDVSDFRVLRVQGVSRKPGSTFGERVEFEFDDDVVVTKIEPEAPTEATRLELATVRFRLALEGQGSGFKVQDAFANALGAVDPRVGFGHARRGSKLVIDTIWMPEATIVSAALVFYGRKSHG